MELLCPFPIRRRKKAGISADSSTAPNQHRSAKAQGSDEGVLPKNFANWLATLVYNHLHSDCSPRELNADALSCLSSVLRPLGCQPFHRGEERQIMAKTVCKILGVVFLLVGIAGFFAPTLLGAHLTPPHNLVHIVSGVIALYFGFAGSLGGAKGFCLVFGIVYLALGLLGMFVFGDPAMDRMWHVVGILSLAKVDHLIHVLLGLIFLAGGLFTKGTAS
jgi:hypothetical protein